MVKYNTINLCAQLSSMIYDTSQSPNIAEEMRKLVSNDATILTITDHEIGNKNNYRACALIDHSNKRIFIVTSGTRVTEGIRIAAGDIIDDIRLSNGLLPSKCKSAHDLNVRIVKLLDELDDASSYEIFYTGHSLGAAISDIAARDMAKLCSDKYGVSMPQITSLTYENPGTYYLTRDTQVKVESIIINGKDNCINSMAPQNGRCYKLFESDSETNKVGLFTQIIRGASSAMDSWTGGNKLFQWGLSSVLQAMVPGILLSPLSLPVLVHCAHAASYGRDQIDNHSIQSILKELHRISDKEPVAERVPITKVDYQEGVVDVVGETCVLEPAIFA